MKKIPRIIISILLIAAIIVPVAIFANAEVNVSTTPAKQSETSEYYNLKEGLYTKKTITDLNNGNFQVELESYTSDVRFLSNDNKQILDIMCLIDYSSSMNNNNRMKQVRDALNKTMTSLINNYKFGEKYQANISIWSFSNGCKDDLIYNSKKLDYTALTAENYFSTGTFSRKIEDKIEALKAHGAGGTDTEEAFKRMNQVIGDRIEAVKNDSVPHSQILLFFTDGVPSEGTGGFDEELGRKYANGAIEQAEKLKEKGVTIYSIGIGDEFSALEQNDKALKNILSENWNEDLKRATLFINIVSSGWTAKEVKSYCWKQEKKQNDDEKKNSWVTIPENYNIYINPKNPQSYYYIGGEKEYSKLASFIGKSILYSMATRIVSSGSLLGDYTLKDTVSDYFEVVSGTTKIYKVPYVKENGTFKQGDETDITTQYGALNRGWGEATEITDKIKYTETKSYVELLATAENSSVLDTCIVDDVVDETETHTGNKLRVTFEIRPKDSFVGGIVPTNDYNNSGVFDSSGNAVQNFAKLENNGQLTTTSPLLQVALVNATAKIDSDNVKIGYIYNLSDLGQNMPILIYSGRYTGDTYTIKYVDEDYVVYDADENKVIYSPASTTTDDNGKTVTVAETKPNDFTDIIVGDTHLANDTTKSDIVSNSKYVQFNSTGISRADDKTYSKNNPNVNKYVYLSWSGISTQDKYIKERFLDYNNTGKDSKAAETDGIVDGIRYYFGREATRQLGAKIDINVYVPAIIVNDAVLSSIKTYPVDSKALSDAFDDFNSQNVKNNAVDTDTLNASMNQGTLSSLVSARTDTSSNEFVLLKPNGTSLTVDSSNNNFIDDAFDINEQSNITAYVKAFADVNGNAKSASSTIANKDQLKFTLSYDELEDEIKTLTDAPFKLTVDEFWATNECTECDAADKYVPQFMGYQAQVHIINAENSITVNKTGCDTNHSNTSFVFTVFGFKTKADGNGADLSTMKALNNFTIQGNGKQTIKVNTAEYQYFCVVEDLNALSNNKGWTWDYSDVSINGGSWIKDNNIESHIFSVGEDGADLTFNNIYDDSNSNLHYASAYAVNIMSNDNIETVTSPANVAD